MPIPERPLPTEKLARRGRELLDNFLGNEAVPVGEQLFHISEALDLLEINRIHVTVDTEDGVEVAYDQVTKLQESYGDTTHLIDFLLIFVTDSQNVVLYNISHDTALISFALDQFPITQPRDFIILLNDILEKGGITPSQSEIKRNEVDSLRSLFVSQNEEVN